MRRTWSLVLALTAIAVGVAAFVAAGVASGRVPCAIVSTQPPCQVALVPGPTEDTLGLVTIEGATTYPSTGRLLLTTVAVRENLDLASWWEARRSPTVDTVPRETVYPPELDREETVEQNALLMEDSQSTAALAALQAAGYDVAGAASGAAVAAVEPDAVTDQLEVGDTITAVDGTDVVDAAGVVEVVRAAAPGRRTALTVRDVDGAERTVEITYGANPSDPAAAYIGVLLRTQLDLPVDVSIDAGLIGGPSAGLMFSLGVLELLGEEDLTGGAVVAGTGTIDVDGRIGPVGGVRQKLTAAASRTEVDGPAEVFLVPRANLGEARRAHLPRDLLLVPVDDLDDALAALADLRDGRRPQEAIAAGPGATDEAAPEVGARPLGG